MNKRIRRVNNLVAIKSKIRAAILEGQYTSKLRNQFKKYSKALATELLKARFFDQISLDSEQLFAAEQFNQDLVFAFGSSPIKEMAVKNVSLFLRPIIQEINREQTHRDIISELSLRAYNLGGMTAAVTTTYMVRSLKIKRKTGFDEMDEEFDLADDFSSARIGGVTVHFNLNDQAILTQMSNRVNNINFVTDLDFQLIVNTIVESGYINRLGPRHMAHTLREKMEGLSERRAQLIARTESNIWQTNATMDYGKKTGFNMKRWLTVHDPLVRELHTANENVGPVPIHETFAESTEYSPAESSSPFSCRCSILLEHNMEAGVPDQYWDGEDDEDMFDDF